MDDPAKKVRSPQFPFISLEKAVERARVFEAEYKHHAARTANAAKLWGYAEKSSGGIQTVAALLGYGLMEVEGTLGDRKLRLTKAALTILKDERPGARPDALRTAALRPRVFAELWKAWGSERPPSVECISYLVLERHFADEAARSLLVIYDANISYADLGSSDKIPENSPDPEDIPPDPEEDKSLPEVSQPDGRRKVPLMANERVIFAHEIRPDQGFRLVATGTVDRAMAESLKAFAEFQLKLLESLPKDRPVADQDE
jgi:hypothetical protein